MPPVTTPAADTLHWLLQPVPPKASAVTIPPVLVNDALNTMRCTACNKVGYIPSRIAAHPGKRYDAIDGFRASHRECRNYPFARAAREAHDARVKAHRDERQEQNRPNRERREQYARQRLHARLASRGLQLSGLLAGRPMAEPSAGVRSGAF